MTNQVDPTPVVQTTKNGRSCVKYSILAVGALVALCGIVTVLALQFYSVFGTPQTAAPAATQEVVDSGPMRQNNPTPAPADIVPDQQSFSQAEAEKISENAYQQGIAEGSAQTEIERYGFAVTENDVVKLFDQNLPSYNDFRDLVPEEGAPASVVLQFNRTYEHDVVLLRAVPDDLFDAVTYYPVNGDPVELLPLLKMAVIDAGCLDIDSVLRTVLESRNVNCEEGELLPQNLNAILLGDVEKGSFIRFTLHDDPQKGVNNGLLVFLSHDSDPYTVDLTGTTITNPTFIPEGYPAPAE